MYKKGEQTLEVRSNFVGLIECTFPYFVGVDNYVGFMNVLLL